MARSWLKGQVEGRITVAVANICAKQQGLIQYSSFNEITLVLDVVKIESYLSYKVTSMHVLVLITLNGKKGLDRMLTTNSM